MKKIQILLVLLMVGIPTMEAQNYKMVLKKTDGTTHEFPVEDIMEISMEEIVSDLPLRVIVSENEMITPSASAKSKRMKARAPITSTSTLTSFTMHGNSYNYQLTKESSQWKASPDYWPRGVDRDADVTFCAIVRGIIIQMVNISNLALSIIQRTNTTCSWLPKPHHTTLQMVPSTSPSTMLVQPWNSTSA